ncbi:BTAD domain-containing putative transcriptional regulator [Bailinhaonella thermotolerans]|uniref:BTAD domain-containing putative transcriptional regulator n=1 Tax=Bailinhaonella thermotolerans TaxID=1070861 RepID=UPI001F5B3A6E|nr:BTAD domain-containing putative transcriptional regulator [Bailinhaonella thermotolerans]
MEVRGDDGGLISVGGSRARGLLVMLAAEAGRVVSLERLGEGQYGGLDDVPADVANAVQAQVSRLRRRLPAGVISFEGGGYRLAIDPDRVDAHRFERLAGEGRRALSAGRHAEARALLGEALALWRGEALADLGDAPYARNRRVRLEELRLGAIEDRAEAALAAGETGAAGELRELVAAHPLRERARGLLMRALHAEGRAGEALAEYEHARRLLAEELGADPSPELAGVHLEILRGEARPRPAAVPAPLTRLVGRDRELAHVLGLEGARLVTITGPGGIGKTRLAVEAARRYGDACFVDLSPVEEVPAAGPADANAVAHAALVALGVREGGLRGPGAAVPDPVERVTRALAERELTLVLDNCEHVIGAAAALVRRVLAACPAVRVLATSREPLGITGEVLVPLPPLEVPPPDAEPARALASPAVRLFLERAAASGLTIDPAAVDSGTADPGTVDAVARICAALEGVPLAIELAAVRLRAFTPQELARRLAEHDLFRVLSRGDRTAAARHRTLRAAIAWSWDLLGERERAVARRFTVFAGGATLEAAEHVCALRDEPAAGPEAASPAPAMPDPAPAGHGPVESLDPEDVADLLADLVDKSLIEVEGGGYRMLSTIRLFCAERLAEAGEEDRARRVHAGWFLALAQRTDPSLRRAGQVAALDLLRADHANLQAALRWAVRADPALALRLTAALAAYWWLSGRAAEAASQAPALLAAVDTRGPRALAQGPGDAAGPRPQAEPGIPGEPGMPYAGSGTPGPDPGPGPGAAPLTADEWARTREGYVAAAAFAITKASPGQHARAEEIMRSLEGPLRHPFVAALWGMNAGPMGPEELRRQLTLFADDTWNLALMRLGDGLLALLNGEPETGERALSEALGGFRELEERWGVAQALDGLAVLATLRGEWARASGLREEALRLLDRLGALDEMVDVAWRWGDALVREGDLDAAADRYGRAAGLARRAGMPGVPAPVHLGLGRIARIRGDLAEARERYEAALRTSVKGAFAAGGALVAAHVALGRLAEAEGDPDEARLRYRDALAAARETPLPSDIADAAEGLAAAALLDGDPARAAVLLGAAVALRGMRAAGDRDVEATEAGARRLLGEAAFAETFARAAALPRDRAVAAVLS